MPSAREQKFIYDNIEWRTIGWDAEKDEYLCVPATTLTLEITGPALKHLSTVVNHG